MGVALHNLQRGVEDGIVDGGGGLADAAADALHRRAARVHRRPQIALVGGAAAGGVVIREDLPGHEHHTVADLGGQLHVALPVGGAAHPAGALPQQVPEQLSLQALLGLLGLGDGQGDLHGLPLRRRVKQGFGLVHVKVDPYHVVADLQGLRVDLGALGLGVELLIHSVKVGLLGGGLVGGEHHRLHRGGAALHRVGHRLGHGGHHHGLGRLPVDGHSGDPLGEQELISLHGIGGVGEGAPHLEVRLVHFLLQLRLSVVGPGQSQADLILRPQLMGQIGRAPEQKAAPAGLPGLSHRGLIVHPDGGGGDLPLPGAVLQGQRHAGHLPQIVLQGLQSLFPGQSPHRHAGHGDSLQNIGRAAHPGAQSQVGRQQHCRGAAGGNQGDLPSLPRLGRDPLRRMHFFHVFPPRPFRSSGTLVFSLTGGLKPARSHCTGAGPVSFRQAAPYIRTVLRPRGAPPPGPVRRRPVSRIL